MKHLHPLTRSLSLFLALNLLLPPELPLAVLAAEALGRVTVNDGQKSRSLVTNVVLSLRTNEAFLPAETLVQKLGIASRPVTNWSLTAGAFSNLVILTFTNQNGRALEDGNYLASFVTKSLEDTNTARENTSVQFHSFFGDVDGDRDVDFLDTFFFRESWLTEAPNLKYDARFDLDGDGGIGASEREAFVSNYFRALPPQPAIFAHLERDDGESESDRVTSSVSVKGKLFPTNDTYAFRGALRLASSGPLSPELILPFDLSSDLNSDGSFVLSSNRLAEIYGATLQNSSYRLSLQIVEENGLPSANFELPFTLSDTNCIWQGLDGWKTYASPPNLPTSTNPPIPGSVTFQNCEIVLREGDSFLVSAEWEVSIENDAKVLVISFDGPVFDTRASLRIKDAFEIAVLGADGLPLTYTIESASGETPANPRRDACFNLPEGQSPILAPGVALFDSTVYIDLSHLSAGEKARVVCRLVNNDEDNTSEVHVRDIGLQKDFPQGVAPQAVLRSFVRASNLETAGSFTFSSRTPLQGQALQKSRMSALSAPETPIFPIASNITVHSNYIVEIFANNIRGACALAFPPAGSRYGDNLYVTTDPTPVGYCSGQPSDIYRISPDGVATRITRLEGRWLEASPWFAAFPPPGSVYGDNLYVSANDLAGDPCAQFDGGGTIITIPVDGGWTNFTGIGTAGGGPKNPYAITFTHGSPFGDRLLLARCDSTESARFSHVNLDGSMDTLFDPGQCTSGFVLGKGPWEGLLLFNKDGGIKGLTSQLALTNVAPFSFISMTVPTGPHFGKHLYLSGLTSAVGNIHRITPSGELESFADGFGNFSAGNFGTTMLDNLEFSSNGRFLFVSDWERNTIYRIRRKVEPAALFISLKSVPETGRVGEELLLSGAVNYTGNLSERGKALIVKLNGVPVEALDVAGNFYSRVTLQNGTNDFVVSAEDEKGTRAEASITVLGTPSGSPVQISALNEVSGSVSATYGTTSFQDDTSILFSDLAIKNLGARPLQPPLLVGFARLSDPSIRLVDADGVTPEGIPFFDFSALLTNGMLPSGETTGYRTIAFYNPNKVQFTYDLVILGQPNDAPYFTTVPTLDATVGKPYKYNFEIIDPDGDPIQASLNEGPASATVSNQSTGQLNWTPTQEDLGTHHVQLEANDPYGNFAKQLFIVEVVAAKSNRPPIFVSKPVTIARIVGTTYEYNALATDPDNDDLHYSVMAGPAGFGINSFSGLARWSPTMEEVGEHEVTIKVEDGRGGVAHQAYQICVIPDRTNRNPVIVSSPINSITAGETYSYEVRAIDPDRDALDFTLKTAPSGMQINATNGAILWQPTPGFFTNAVAFQESEFSSTLGNGVLFGVNNTPVVAVTTRNDGGNSGAFEEFALTQGVANGKTPIAWYFYPRQKYFPGQAGGIREIEYSEDRLRISSTIGAPFGQFGGLAIRQNGRIYVHSVPTGAPTGWQRFFFSHLTENDFVLADYDSFGNNSGVKQYPDFSETSAVLEFGTFRLLSDSPTSQGYQVVEGLDNWSVLIHPVQRESVQVVVSDRRGGIASQDFFIASDRGNRVSGFVFQDLDENGRRSVQEELWAGTRRYDTETGVLVNRFASLGSEVFSYGPDGFLYESDRFGRRILRYDPNTFEMKGVFAQSDELYFGTEFVFGPSGGLFFLDFINSRVLRFDGITGAYLGVFARDSNLLNPMRARFGPNGNLFVSSIGTSRVLEFDARSGQLVKVFALPDSGLGATGLDFGPDGNLYVGTYNGDNVYRFDSATGLLIDEFITSGTGGLDVVADVRFSPSGNLFVASSVNQRILEFDNTSGDFLRTVVSGESGSLRFRTNAVTEPPLSPSIVYLDKNGNKRRDTGDLTATTDSNGFFTFRNLNSGTHTIRQELRSEWKVSEGSVASRQVTVTNGGAVWEVSFGNVPRGSNDQNGSPSFVSAPITVARVWLPYRYAANAADPEGDDVLYRLVSGPQGMVIDDASGVVVWEPNANEVGSHEVILKAEDPFGRVALQSFQISVLNPDVPPSITTIPGGPAVVDLPYRYIVRGQDTENGKLSFSLGASTQQGITLTDSRSYPNQAVLDWTPRFADLGTNQIEIWVRDESGAEARQIFDLNVVASAENRPPSFISTPRKQARIGMPWSYLAETWDSDGDRLTVSLVHGPAGLMVTDRIAEVELPNTALASWIPESEGTFGVTLAVSDGRTGGVVTQEFIVTVSSTLQNASPIIGSIPPTGASADSLYEYRPYVLDSDGDMLAWRIIEAPHGMSIDASTGFLLWSPAESQIGTNRVTITASDPFGGIATQSFEIDVSCVNQSPSIYSVPLVVVPAGEVYLYAPRANDPDDVDLTWILESPAPERGMTMNAANGLIRWLPTTNDLGAHSVQIRVSDKRGGSGTQNFTLYVVSQEINHPPVFTSSPIRGATVGRIYSYPIRTFDRDGDELTISIASGPTGVALTPGARNEAFLTWEPTAAQYGPHEFIVVAKDPSSASAFQRFTVTVRSNAPPVITSYPIRNAVPGVPYLYDLTAYDPDGDPLTFGLVGAPPTGLTMDAAGRIAWTPQSSQVGSHNLQVLITDFFGATATQNWSITVSADMQPPEVYLSMLRGLIDPAGNWTADLSSSAQLIVRATDNVRVESLRLVVGGKSLGLSDRGVAVFTPENTGFFPVVATATDAAGNVGVATNRIRVVNQSAENNITIQFHSPADNSLITKRTPIVGSISSTDNLLSYTVDYAIAGDVNLQDIAADNLAYVRLTNVTVGAGVTAITNAVLAVFDPTVLLNDSYLIRVSASDANGNISYEGMIVNVEGDLKFGEFRMEFLDLSIPVAGIPIQVKRVYDTRLAKREGDFSFGWFLGDQDARIKVATAHGGLQNGARVYLTGPDGRRIGFTAELRVTGGGFLGIVATTYVFRPDPGVYAQLEADGLNDIYFGDTGIIEMLDGPFRLQNVRLTTKEGLVYHYDQDKGLQRVVDRNGNRLEYTDSGIFHYAAGEATSGQNVQFRRDQRGRIKKIIDPAGKSLVYSYGGAGDLRAFTDQSTNVTEYFYDSKRAHFLTNIVDPFGKSALILEYDETGKLATVRDAAGNPINQDFDADLNVGTFTDARGNQTIVHFDDRGNEIARIIPGISTNRFAYDANGNLTNAVNGRGYQTNFVYDARGNPTRIEDALSNITTIAYNDFNKPTAITNALKQVLRMYYDRSGQLTQVVNNLGFKTSFARDHLGRMTNLVDAAGNTNSFVYEGGCSCGLPGMVINPDGTFRQYVYDAFGRTNLVINELGAETEFRYDDSGRLLWTRDALTNYTSYYNDGPRLTNIVDALNRETRFVYDDFGRTNFIINAEGGTNEFRYDENGNRTHVIDPVGNVTRFIYDAANRVTNRIDTFGRTNHFVYDAANNQIETSDRNGRRRTFAYDALNRMTNELWWEGTNVVRSISFGFNELGIQTFAEDPAARYDYEYDDLNRLERVSQTKVPGQVDFTLDYTYTSLGQVETVTDNWDVQVGSKYNTRNLLERRTWQGPGIDPARVDFYYNATGNRGLLERFSDLGAQNRIGFTTNAYNRAGLITNITHLGPAGQVLARYGYDFDAAYQIRRWTINSEPSHFDYDRTGQLTDALNAAQPHENFRYDPNGNRIGAQTSGSYVVGGNNQILSDGTNRYGYDAEGNLTSRSNILTGVLTEYQWDHRNRLTNVLDYSRSGVATQRLVFAYDAMNRRLAKTVNAETTRFLYNMEDSWADLDGANAVIARYLHGARIDELIARQRASDGRGWYLTDHVGSVRDISNSAGGVVAQVSYSSFGQVLSVGNLDDVDRFQFAGRDFDQEIRWYFFRARFYDPSVGRFIGEDPIRFESNDLNLYRYVINNPLSLVDPFGTSVLFEEKVIENEVSLAVVNANIAARAAFAKKVRDVIIGLAICIGTAGVSLEDGVATYWEIAVVLLTCAAPVNVAAPPW